jgi:Uma2 family endonuclease
VSVQSEQRYYTPEEYLAREEKADDRSEYRDGEIIPMTGGTTNHNKIALNFVRRFPLVIDEQDYEIYLADVRLWIPKYHLYTYPDVMVIQGEPIYEGTGINTITNPRLIVEVLSKSTRDYDKTDKFKYYRSIPEFQEYILIDQYSFQVEQYIKKARDQWLFKYYEGEQAVLQLASISFEISLSEIYAKINFQLTND